MHLLQLGLRRLAFVGEANVAGTVDARIAGFREALLHKGLAPTPEMVVRGNPRDETFVRSMMETVKPDGIVCANDLTAARLMQALLALGYAIPEQVRIVGMDDVKYAGLLPVPLTTVHQDCAGIGMVAMATMLERLEHPELPPRDVLVPTRLVVRKSCGAHLHPEVADPLHAQSEPASLP
jgi:GntR family transcriptional regulator, arabinose operon transcriptional repressor